MKDSAPPSAVPDTWYQVRKKVGDIRHTLPQESQGRPSTTNSATPSATSSRSPATASATRTSRSTPTASAPELLRVPDVTKVDNIGEQEEKIYIELSNTKLATLGVDVQTIVGALRRRTPWRPPARSRPRPTRSTSARPANSTRSKRSANRRCAPTGACSASATSRACSAATPTRRCPKMRFQGKEAIGLGGVDVQGGDIVALGATSTSEIARLAGTLPSGSNCAGDDQPKRCSARSTSSCARWPRR